MKIFSDLTLYYVLFHYINMVHNELKTYSLISNTILR